MKDTTACPECGEEAEVQWRAVLESTDGPVEHAKLRCRRRHSFLMPLYLLDRRHAAHQVTRRPPTQVPSHEKRAS
jgi:hypothetical protein